MLYHDLQYLFGALNFLRETHAEVEGSHCFFLRFLVKELYTSPSIYPAISCSSESVARQAIHYGLCEKNKNITVHEKKCKKKYQKILKILEMNK